MQRFFSSLYELDQFTRSLDSQPSIVPCRHCSRTDQWISHGYVYKFSGEKVGKRILCGKRYGKQGCGHTFQLYLRHIIPQRRYTLSELMAFILALVNGATVEQAFHQALQHSLFEHRQAWRWLNALWQRMGRFRASVATVPPVQGAARPRCRSRRLTLLLSTLGEWLRGFPDRLAIQVLRQERFY